MSVLRPTIDIDSDNYRSDREAILSPLKSLALVPKAYEADGEKSITGHRAGGKWLAHRCLLWRG